MCIGHRGWIIAFVVFGATAPVAQAVDQEVINQAIAGGVNALRRMQGRDGSWRYTESGMTSLAALTLLECDVPANDVQIKAAAEYIRAVAPEMTQTYSIALAIVFLDRVGDPQDVPLVESLTIRLLAGQRANGGWHYTCPPIADSEIERLRTVVKNRVELKGGVKLPEPKRRTAKDLPKEIQQQLTSIARAPQFPRDIRDTYADNSNTQFATLALWVGRRHGLPVDSALARVDARYRRTQSPVDGAWGYGIEGPKAPVGIKPPPGVILPDQMPSTPAMTCAAILGMTVAHGVANDPQAGDARVTDPMKDPVLQKGLLALATAIGNPGDEVPPIRGQNGKAYYFLWSLERVAVALNLEQIGKKDWYQWGAEVLIANQGAGGMWIGEYGECGADTCFALMFLRRANLMRDLSNNLKGKVKDPFSTELKGGGLVLTPPKEKLGSGLAAEKKNAHIDIKDKNPKKQEPIPTRSENKKAEELSDKLVDASEENRDKVLAELKDSKGVEYTEALAFAIPRLSDREIRDKARDALAERLVRLKAASLVTYIKDPDPEIRRAALLASGTKKLEEHIPLMVERLNDADPDVVRAAYTSLKHISKEDFGPQFGATREEHEKSVKLWKEWAEKKKP